MSYNKQNFKDGQVLNAEHLNHIEDGIVDAQKVASLVNLTAYESEGKIVETYPDGSVVTSTVEFDADGNPIKITNSNGNVTVLTW